MAGYRHCRREHADRFICTTDGLSLIEVLVALCLSLVLLLGIAPLWVSLYRTGVGTHEVLVDLQRWRVVAARLERDLRMASGDVPGRLDCVPVLEATATRVVFVTQSAQAEGLEIVAWEIVAGSLMRRRAPLPLAGPPTLPSAFQDNKTMLEGTAGGTFSYSAGGLELGTAVPPTDLRRVGAVRFECRVTGSGHRHGVVAVAGTSVAR